VKIKVRIGDIGTTKADAILLGIFEDEKKTAGDIANLDKSLNGEIAKLLKQGEIKGKQSEITVIHSLGKIPSDRVTVIGLGKKEDLTEDKIRIITARCLPSVTEKRRQTKSMSLYQVLELTASPRRLRHRPIAEGGSARFVHFHPASV